MSDLPSTSRLQRSEGSSDENAGSIQQAPTFNDNRQSITNVTINVHQPLQGSSTSGEIGTNASANIESRWQKLIEFSKKQAKALYGREDSILEDQKINIAPLELSTQPRESELADVFGHFHHRNEIADAYNKSSRIIDHSKLFNEARDLATKESEKHCSTREAMEEYQLANGNVVGVIGQAGVGKSTLAKLLVREVLEQDLYNAELVFLLRFCDLNFETKQMNLLQLLTPNSTFANDIPQNELTQLLKKLSESDRVLFVFDGYDEAIMKKTSTPLTDNCSIYKETDAETFIKHLISGKLLPKAKKLFTSRPRQFYELHKSCRPRFIVNVLGLNGEAQKKICHDICENGDACVQVVRFVNDRPDLKTFCYVPANCILVMYCLNETFKSGNLTTLVKIDSITSILIATIQRFIEHGHLREGFQIKNLSCLAHTTFVSNRIMFEQKDLESNNISKKQASTFLTTRLGKKANLKLLGGSTQKNYFSHLLLHEFFVAVYFILFMDADEFDKRISNLTESKYEMVTRFVFGLCNSNTQDYLQVFIPSEELDLSHNDEKKKMLENLALEQVASAERISELLQGFSWIYELRDDEITEKIVSNLKSELEVTYGSKILPSDIPAFQYVLQQRKSPLTLTVNYPNFEGGCCEQFLAALHVIMQRGNVKIKKLWIAYNELGDESLVHLATCIHNVKVLSLQGCKIGTNGVRILSQGIARRDNPIKELWIEDNELGDESLVQLATCIQKVEVLRLWRCRIATKSVRILSQGIAGRDNPIKKLSISYNELGDESLVHLAACIHNVEGLSLRGCKIATNGVRILSQGIAGRDNPIGLLSLGGNEFGDEGAEHLKTCLHNIKRLYVDQCGISDDVCRYLESNIAGSEA